MTKQEPDNLASFICLKLTNQTALARNFDKLITIIEDYNINSFIGDKLFISQSDDKNKELIKFYDIISNRSIPLIIKNNFDMPYKCDGLIIDIKNEDDINTLKEIKNKLDKNKTIGASIMPSKHLAMLVGEAGADFISVNVDDECSDDAIADSQNEILNPYIFIRWWHDKAIIPLIASDIKDMKMAKKAWNSGADYLLFDEELWLLDKNLSEISNFHH